MFQHGSQYYPFEYYLNYNYYPFGYYHEYLRQIGSSGNSNGKSY